MRPGFVYILGNPGLSAYKVGQTTRTAEIRAAELLREYGMVEPFVIASRRAVDNPAAVEALAHRYLTRYRVPRSELFACDLATCQRAVMKAAKRVLHCPWWLRLWYRLTLPRPQARRRPYARRGYRRDDPTALLLFLVALGVVVALAALKPDLPAWMPSGILRAVALVERL